ncbi:DUF2474 family protein [Nitratireductor sp. XY-223]|nr:DUF2474 family protein [Nitratireductor sp. XY-223]
MDSPDPRPPLWNRLLWFVLLWGAGVVTIAVVGYALRSLFFPS